MALKWLSALKWLERGRGAMFEKKCRPPWLTDEENIKF